MFSACSTIILLSIKSRVGSVISAFMSYPGTLVQIIWLNPPSEFSLNVAEILSGIMHNLFFIWTIFLNEMDVNLQVSLWIGLTDFARDTCWALWFWSRSISNNDICLPNPRCGQCLREALGMFSWYFTDYERCYLSLSLCLAKKVSSFCAPQTWQWRMKPK